MFRAIPLLVITFLLYNAITVFSDLPAQEIFYGTPVHDPATNTVVSRGAEMFTISLPGGSVDFLLGDLIIILGLLLLGVEMVKATYSRGAHLIDRVMSPLLLVLILVEFLLIPKAASSVFFMLLAMSLFDVTVGEVVGIRAARRDIGFGGGDA